MQVAGTVVMTLAFGFFVSTLSAQTAAESVAAMANATIAAQAKPPALSAGQGRDQPQTIFETTGRPGRSVSSKRGTSSILISHPGPPVDEVNRKHFEENSGKDAGKVLFRSVPSGAAIFVNHLLVGNTPLLMFLAPGKYAVEMRGAREDSGHKTVGVMPNQVQKVVIDLSQRYPSGISLRW